MKRITVLLFFFFLMSTEAMSQCAMCRATIENNVANGEIGIGAGLNFGILYLFVMPYLAVMVVGYLWYKNSKANARKQQGRRYPVR
ncbi:hypothetical protein [Fulvivirga sedimenti]|uniref:Uncharacterized protein n=1 Tax=Fulvivirga sedimenti TaxID=2879465 RepID=A0A9X1KUK8_9BACT|nr:hypothetical protein [Fulvivirga sedimenti]MCA6073623.1 hypothetical protein [Fulvivirga sedimenti]